MKTISFSTVAGAVGLFFGTALCAQTLTTASLIGKPELAQKFLQLSKVTICTNDESNDLALADAGELAKKDTRVSQVGMTMPDGTNCATVDRADLAALLTGRAVAIGGSDGPLIAEIYSRHMGHAYVIILSSSALKVATLH